MDRRLRASAAHREATAARVERLARWVFVLGLIGTVATGWLFYTRWQT